METIPDELENQEIEVLFDRRANQRIPLVASGGGSTQSKCWHHLKPLSDERYFQYEDESEVLAHTKTAKLSEIYKPKYSLWRELFIEREGVNEKDSDVLFVEAVQAINALLYYEPFPVRHLADDELLDENETVYFGAMYSGAWLGLKLGYDPKFPSKIDEFHETQKNKFRMGLSYRAQHKAERLHAFALPHLKGVHGYAKSENLIDSVPAWHVVNSATELFLSSLNLLSSKPMIAGGVFGQ